MRAHARTTETAILLAGILMILGPGMLMVLNIQITEKFFGAKDILAQSSIGEISKPRKVVRKKGEDDSAYLKAKQGDPVFEGDTVITGKDSSAKVALSDGTVLELGPESMIRIEPVRSFSIGGIKKKFEVTVETGAIKAKAKSNSAPVVLKSGKGEVLKEIAPVSEVKRQTPGFLPVLTRNLPIPLPFQPKVAVKPSPSAPKGPRVEEEGFEEEALVSIPAPSMPATPVAGGGKPPIGVPAGSGRPGVPVAVPGGVSGGSSMPGVSAKDLVPDAEELIEAPLELEEKPILSKPVLAMAPRLKPLPAIPAIPLPSLPPVAETTPTPAPTPAATPLVVATPTPAPKVTRPKPAQNEIVLIPARLQDQRFLLSWKDLRTDPKPQYKVSVIQNGRTSNIIASETETTWALPSKREGTISWFVEGLSEDGSFVKSDTRMETWKIATVVSIELIPEGSEILGDKIRVYWKDLRKSPTGPYKVSIVHSGKTDTVVSSSNDALWSIPLQAYGKLEWFIEAPDAVDGFIKSKSLATAWKFKTPTLMFPKADASVPEHYLKGDRHELLLTWTPLNSCQQYYLNVSRSPRFETLLYTKITARHFQRFPVEAIGEHYWRVGCSYGEDFVVYSNPRRFKIEALNQTKASSPIKIPAPSGSPARSAVPGPSAKPVAR
jgi:hypothetical protein